MTAALQLNGPAPRTREEALAIFRQCAREIWRNADACNVSVAERGPSSDAVAAIAGRSACDQFNRYVTNPEWPRVLYVSERALSLDDEALRRVMIHEAVHLGIGGHSARFRRVCVSHGGAMSGGEAEGRPVQVQRKEGARYRTVREFPRECIEEAKAWGSQLSRNTGFRYRIVY
jgi:hypothetical protein